MAGPAEKGASAGQVKVAVLGAGHGGLALAGDLGRMGFEVTLFSFFPDDLDYGLRLAEAQISAGHGKEALNSLAELRKLPFQGLDRWGHLAIQRGTAQERPAPCQLQPAKPDPAARAELFGDLR